MSFNAKLTTKLDKFSLNDPIIELKNTIDRDELNNIVRNLLKSLGQLDEDKSINVDNLNFEFLVGGRFLRLSVEKHLELYSDELDAREILSEKLVEVEYLLSLDAPEPLDQFKQDDWVSSIDVNETYIITGSYDNSIRIYSIKDRKNILTIKDAHAKPISRVRWLKSVETSNKKNELYFVSCGHDEVILMRRFNTKTLKIDLLTRFNGHSRSVNCVDSNDNLIATGSFDKTLRIWSTSLVENDDEENNNDVENRQSSDKQNSKKKQKIKSADKSITKSTKTAIMTLTGHQESITGVKWLGSCCEFNSVASSSLDKSICIWDVEVGECKRRLLSAKPILGIDYCEEKNLVLSASCDRHIRLWDSRASDNATAKAAYTSHNAWVSSVAFGKRDTNNFVSGGYDNLVKLWDLRSPKACLYDLIGHHDKVLDINFNIDYVSSCSADSTVKTFKI